MADNGIPSAAGPPFQPTTQSLGEVPSIIPDVPVNVVFLLLFLFGGVAHMTILQINERRHHKKFALNGATFGFCVTRVAATSLRIAWAVNQRSIPLGLASTIFFYAGVVLLFIANLFFAQRIVRAQHPHVGWSLPFKVAVPAFIFVTIATILCLIAAIVTQFYANSDYTHQQCRDILLYGASFYTLMAFVPLPVVIISSLARLHPKTRNRTPLDKFGEGSMRMKVFICLLSGVLLVLGAAFRAGTSYLPPVPLFTADGQMVPTPWYFSRAAFYAFNFSIEAFIVWFWVFVRIDKRFIVPNGSSGPYSYAGGFIFAGEQGNEKRNIGKGDSERQLVNRDSILSRRSSWNTSKRSLAASSRVSWGGISRDDIHDGIGEDGIEITPYAALDEPTLAQEEYYDNHDQEMGWDPKTGKWALRPISSAATLRYSRVEP